MKFLKTQPDVIETRSGARYFRWGLATVLVASGLTVHLLTAIPFLPSLLFIPALLLVGWRDRVWVNRKEKTVVHRKGMFCWFKPAEQKFALCNQVQIRRKRIEHNKTDHHSGRYVYDVTLLGGGRGVSVCYALTRKGGERTGRQLAAFLQLEVVNQLTQPMSREAVPASSEI